MQQEVNGVLPEERRLRIVFLIGAFFPNPLGASYSAIRLAKSLREHGMEISFIVDSQAEGWEKGGTYEGFPVQSFRLHKPGKWGKLCGLAAFTLYIWRRRREVDVFYINGGGYVNLFLGWWAGLVTGWKICLKMTSDGWDTPDGAVNEKWGFLVPFFYSRLDGIVAMTNGQAVKCRQRGWDVLVATIPNGVDTSIYRPVTPSERQQLRRELELPADACILIYLGSLGKGKGTDVLFEVWNRLAGQNSSLFLLVVGDYTGGRILGVSLADFLSSCGLNPSLLNSKQLRQLGQVSDAERYLQSSDILMFPSRREGFGTVQIEAMACGLVCVANDLPGVSCDILPDETVGFRIRDNRVEDYIRVISGLVEQPEKREKIGCLARRYVEEYFSMEIVAARYVDFMRQLVENKRV